MVSSALGGLWALPSLTVSPLPAGFPPGVQGGPPGDGAACSRAWDGMGWEGGGGWEGWVGEQVSPRVGTILQGEVPVETADCFLGSAGLTTIGEKGG